MTREEASKVLEMFLYKQCDLERTKFAYDDNTVWDAVKMASESLKQDSVLDKIKAEIKELSKEPAYYIPNYDAYKKVLDIIDKYKTGSEGEG